MKIKLYTARDFIHKSKNAAIGFFLINFIFIVAFLFFEQHHNYFWREIVFFSIIICLFSIIRFYICNNFVKKYRIEISGTGRFFKLIYTMALINAALWAIVETLVFFGGKESITAMISVLIVTIAFTANSIATLGLDRRLLAAFNGIITIPIVVFYFNQENVSSYFNLDLIFGLFVINVIYTFIQGKQVNVDYEEKITNILDLRKLMNALSHSQKKLEEQTLKTFHANRLASLGEMAGGISHEINNPLTIITGMANSVIRKEENPEKIDKLNRIVSAADRISKIVKSMKVLATNSDGADFDICTLDDVLENALDLVKEKFKSTDIRFSLQPIPNVNLRCNKIQISQVLINLLNNANDALEQVEGSKDLYITFELLKSSININVLNSGPEIPKQVSDNLFVPFYTTKPVGKGTGLGLSISKNLMQKHEGDLYYKRIGNLTCFTLTIPR